MVSALAHAVKLFISRTENGQYLVVVSGSGFFSAENKKVAARIRGDDPVFDDSLFSIGVASPTRVVAGEFTLSKTVSGGSLNEDLGQDEIYAIADIEGFGSFRSNTIKGSF